MKQQSLFDNPRPIEPVDPNVSAEDKPRLSKKAQAVLDCLQQKPCTNVELVAVGGMRVSARIHDLRRCGHEIDAEPVGDGVWLYTLKIACL